MHTEQLNTCMSLLPFAKKRGRGHAGSIDFNFKMGGGAYPKNLNKQQPLQSCIKTDKGKDRVCQTSALGWGWVGVT